MQWSERYGVWKLHPLADWDEKRVWAYIRSTRSPTTRCTSRLPLDRLHPVHAADPPEEEERAGRWAGSDKLECGIHLETPLGGHMTDHIYAPEHPETTHAAAASRSGSPGSRAPGRPRSRTSSAPSSSAAASSSSTSTATPCARTCRRASGSRRRTATRTSSASAGSPRGSRASGGAVIAAAISPYEETRRRRATWSRRSAPFVEVFIKRVGRGVRQARREGPLREGLRRRDQGFTGVDDPYEEPVDPELVVDTEAHEPEESARARRRQARGAGPGAGGGDRVSVDRDQLIEPHGGKLVDRTGDAAGRRRVARAVALTSRELSDLDMLASGALSPLEGFMGRRRLRARRRGHAPRERPALGAAGLPRRRRGAEGRPGRAGRRGRQRARRARRRGASTSTTRSARRSGASARPTTRTPAWRGSTTRSRSTSPAA